MVAQETAIQIATEAAEAQVAPEAVDLVSYSMRDDGKYDFRYRIHNAPPGIGAGKLIVRLNADGTIRRIEGEK